MESHKGFFRGPGDDDCQKQIGAGIPITSGGGASEAVVGGILWQVTGMSIPHLPGGFKYFLF